MEEIANCPLCGKRPTKMVFGAGWAQDGYKCCGHTTDTMLQWNKCAAAMDAERRLVELREAVRALRKLEQGIPSTDTAFVHKFVIEEARAPLTRWWGKDDRHHLFPAHLRVQGLDVRVRLLRPLAPAQGWRATQACVAQVLGGVARVAGFARG